MTLGDVDLTDVEKRQHETVPGMAHFAGTGPSDKNCGHCKFYGYKKTATRDGVEILTYTSACQKYFNLTNKHGPNIKANLKSCKYFEGS